MPQPEEVSIELVAEKLASPPKYTWKGTGAIADGGDWTDGDHFWAAIPSPVVGTLHNEITLHGAKGSLGIRFEGLLKPTADSQLFSMEGAWRILTGTESYANMHGSGQLSTIFRFATSSAWGTLTGKVKTV